MQAGRQAGRRHGGVSASAAVFAACERVCECGCACTAHLGNAHRSATAAEVLELDALLLRERTSAPFGPPTQAATPIHAHRTHARTAHTPRHTHMHAQTHPSTLYPGTPYPPLQNMCVARRGHCKGLQQGVYRFPRGSRGLFGYIGLGEQLRAKGVHEARLLHRAPAHTRMLARVTSRVSAPTAARCRAVSVQNAANFRFSVRSPGADVAGVSPAPVQMRKG